MQPDPSGADGVRTYAYVGDDLIDYIDPTGQDEVAGIPGNDTVNFLVEAGAAVLVVATLPVDLAVLVPGVVIGVGTAVVIQAVTYVVTRIHYGPTRTVTIPAYIPHPGDVQTTPVEGGTTATLPGQIPIPTILMSKGGGYEKRETTEGIIEVKRVGDNEVTREMHNDKPSYGAKSTDSFYRSRDGRLWVGRATGELQPYP